jgi:VanZ family protein
MMRSRNLLLVTVAVIAVILHGSLYPYQFRVPPGVAGPVDTLLDSWATPPSSFGTLVANTLLYVPLGFFGALSMRGGRSLRLGVMILAGLVLSAGIEIAQFYDVGRVTNMSDVYLNTSGAALGVIAALVLATAGRHLPATEIAVDPIPVLLLVAMLGYHLYPFVPTIDLHKYWHSVRSLFLAPSLPPYTLLKYFALWLTTSCLIGAVAEFRRSRLFLSLFVVFVFVAKILIENLVLSPSELVGAILAVGVWFVIGHSRRFAALLTGVVLCAAIAVARLEPFNFQAPARAFGWLPFGSFLGGSLNINVMSFLEKFFLYGSLLWLWVEAGLSLWLTTLLAALYLFVTSVAEIYLPGRSAEVTDALMVLMIGLIMRATTNRNENRHYSAPPQPNAMPPLEEPTGAWRSKPTASNRLRR